MTSVFRVGLIRLFGRQNHLDWNAVQSCGISGKAMRGGPRPVPIKPWPYLDKRYGLFQQMYDKTTKRFDENTKIICVEGPIAAGKTKFAKELAAELDMCYFNEANLDMVFINPYNYDMRQLNPELPEECRCYDEKNFCLDPTNRLAAQFQCRMYQLRYSVYVDALAHVLSTGQGAVLDRSPYSDFVFLETMYRHGYISKAARSHYYLRKQHTIGELMKPHLVIYLDCPVEAVKKNIKARNREYEVKSKLFTDDYLKDLETFYKQNFLKDISTHAEILIYDWTEPGDTEVIIEDIERIDFEQFENDEHNKKMKDWRIHLEITWGEQRMKYATNKHTLMTYFNVPGFDVPELVMSAESGKKFREIWYNAPGMKYAKGFNEDMGDTGILTKTGPKYRDTIQ